MVTGTQQPTQSGASYFLLQLDPSQGTLSVTGYRADNIAEASKRYAEAEANPVMRMLADESDQRLVETIITLARQFRLDVVAEGVGDQRTLDMLARMGCDHAQGCLFAPALNAEQLGVWLRGNSGDS